MLLLIYIWNILSVFCKNMIFGCFWCRQKETKLEMVLRLPWGKGMKKRFRMPYAETFPKKDHTISRKVMDNRAPMPLSIEKPQIDIKSQIDWKSRSWKGFYTINYVTQLNYSFMQKLHDFLGKMRFRLVFIALMASSLSAFETRTAVTARVMMKSTTG